MENRNLVHLRRQVLIGELPEDFLRVAKPNPDELHDTGISHAYALAPPNTRGRLTVTILEANLVKNYGLVRMDPYCKLRVGHYIFETQTHLSGARNPSWNRTIHSYLPTGVESVYLQIFDEKAFTADECIGWAHIMLPPSIFVGETIDDYYHLSGQQGEGQEGMLHLVFSFTPIERPPQTEDQQPVGDSVVIPQEVSGPTVTEEDILELVEMFPNIDREVIRCVLEEHRGAKDDAVTSLLTMGSSS